MLLQSAPPAQPASCPGCRLEMGSRCPRVEKGASFACAPWHGPSPSPPWLPRAPLGLWRGVPAAALERQDSAPPHCSRSGAGPALAGRSPSGEGQGQQAFHGKVSGLLLQRWRPFAARVAVFPPKPALPHNSFPFVYLIIVNYKPCEKFQLWGICQMVDSAFFFFPRNKRHNVCGEPREIVGNQCILQGVGARPVCKNFQHWQKLIVSTSVSAPGHRTRQIGPIVLLETGLFFLVCGENCLLHVPDRFLPGKPREDR